MIATFDGIEWRPLRAALILGRIATREFERQKLTLDLTSLAGKSLGALQEFQAKDEESFREALTSIGASATEIEQLVHQVLEISEEMKTQIAVKKS